MTMHHEIPMTRAEILREERQLGYGSATPMVGRDETTGRFVSLAIGIAATDDDESQEGAERLITDIWPNHPNSAYMFMSVETAEERFERLLADEGLSVLTPTDIMNCCSDPEHAAIMNQELSRAGIKEDNSSEDEPYVETKAEAMVRRTTAALSRRRRDEEARAAGLPTRSQRRAANKRARKAAQAIHLQ